MSEQEQLPVCALCGNRAWEAPGKQYWCTTPSCPMRGTAMRVRDWRRLMARPRLAPEHVVKMRGLMLGWYVSTQEAAAIRAALAALGEEVTHE